jgi:alpha-ketoglutarate-dependent taurine dioxygenase
VRGAKTRRELPFHTDLGPSRPDAFLLCCVRPAPRGGTTILVDSRAVLDRLDHHVRAVLATPFPFDISDDARPATDAVTWRPVLAPGAAGSLVTTYNRARIHRGYRALGQRPPTERAAALDAFDAALTAPGLQHPILLRGGDLLGVDNRRFLHARAGFSDDDAGNRLLLRVWLSI